MTTPDHNVRLRQAAASSRLLYWHCMARLRVASQAIPAIEQSAGQLNYVTANCLLPDPPYGSVQEVYAEVAGILGTLFDRLPIGWKACVEEQRQVLLGADEGVDVLAGMWTAIQGYLAARLRPWQDPLPPMTFNCQYLLSARHLPDGPFRGEAFTSFHGERSVTTLRLAPTELDIDTAQALPYVMIHEQLHSVQGPFSLARLDCPPNNSFGEGWMDYVAMRLAGELSTRSTSESPCLVDTTEAALRHHLARLGTNDTVRGDPVVKARLLGVTTAKMIEEALTVIAGGVAFDSFLHLSTVITCGDYSHGQRQDLVDLLHEIWMRARTDRRKISPGRQQLERVTRALQAFHRGHDLSAFLPHAGKILASLDA